MRRAAQRKRDLIAGVSVAGKEAFETRVWLRLVGDSGLLPRKRMAVVAECDEIARMLSSIVLSAKKRD